MEMRITDDHEAGALDHVQIAAPSGGEPQARAFFGGLLGLAEIAKPETMRADGGVWFALAGAELHIGIDRHFAPARKAHPAIRVTAAELDALAERMVAAGVPVQWDERLPGARRFYTEDPFGNRVELLSRE
jgi:catechol 2,3-dioxygenase-like lactoylglutathione lyase family enzyme